MGVPLVEQAHIQREFQAHQIRFFTYLKALMITVNTLTVLGIASNLLVCFVMIKGRKNFQSSVANFLVLHLALTDLVLRFVGITIAVSRALDTMRSPIHCKVIIFFQYTCAAVLFLLLAQIAVDRFFHIVYPLRSLSSNRSRTKRILLTWTFAFIVCSAFFFSATNTRFTQKFRFRGARPGNFSGTQKEERIKEVVFDLQTDGCIAGKRGLWTSQLSVTIFFVFGFLLPLFVMTLCYGKILIFLWKRSRQTGAFNSAVTRPRSKATRVLILIVLTFLISWGPLMVLDTIQPYLHLNLRLWEFPARPLFICFSFTSSILNPLIYAFGNSNFRRELKRLTRRLYNATRDQM